MKKYLTLTLALLLIATFLSCKKNDTAKDYSTSIKDKTWWGEFAYTGKTAEYYSVHFNTDNTLLWSQLSGDYTGHWVVNEHTLTMTFDISSVRIKADIGDDNKFTNITASTSSYIINSGNIITNPNIVLDNTVWKGSVYLGSNAPLQMKFTSPLRIEVTILTTVTGPFNYTRSSSGAVFRTNSVGGNKFFGIIISDNEMKGSDDAAGNPWQLTKQ